MDAYAEAFDAVVARAEKAGINKSALMRAIGHPRPKLYLFREKPEKTNFEALQGIIAAAGSPKGEADTLRIEWYSARRLKGANDEDFRYLVAWINRHLTARDRDDPPRAEGRDDSSGPETRLSA